MGSSKKLRMGYIWGGDRLWPPSSSPQREDACTEVECLPSVCLQRFLRGGMDQQPTPAFTANRSSARRTGNAVNTVSPRPEAFGIWEAAGSPIQGTAKIYVPDEKQKKGMIQNTLP
eukprot:gene16491-biopygen9790